MPHFFITTKDIKNNKITITDKDNFHHIAKVMRAQNGETLLLVDENQTCYQTVIENIDSKTITTKVVQTSKSNHIINLQLYLAQSILKTDAQNFVIQKATELGIKGIIPFVSDNCVIKEAVVDSKIDKWQKIACEAVKQCERTDFPTIGKRSTLADILNSPDYDIKIACVERCTDSSLKSCLQNIKTKGYKDKKIIVIIGPEGGFSAAEIKLLQKAENIHKVSLGKLILRAETAVITALSNVIYELEQDD